jgi:hypothetical protein
MTHVMLTARPRRVRCSGLVAWLVLSLASACSDGSHVLVDAGIPPEVVEHADDWPLPNRDLSEQPCDPRLGNRLEDRATLSPHGRCHSLVAVPTATLRRRLTSSAIRST